MKRTILTASVFALTASLSSYAVAQDAPDEEQEARTLNTVTVTARKKDESLQDVPISINVTSGAEIQETGIRDLQDLTQNLPAVNASQGGASDQIYIRGIGSGFNGGFEQAVGTYIDGAYISRSRGTRLLFMDLDRLEVLKGPQTTFLGNSSIGGAFNVVTRNPGTELGGNASFLYTPEFGETDFQAGLDIPLHDSFRLRVAGRKYDTDGFYSNSNTGGTGPTTDDWGVRVTAVWEPTDYFDANLKYTHGESSSNAGFSADVFDCPVPAPLPGGNPFQPCRANLAAFPAGDPRRFDGQQDYVTQTSGYEPSGANFDSINLSWNWDLGDVILSSLTAYNKLDQFDVQDLDQSELNIFGASQFDEFEAYAQEFRLTSDTESRFSWMVGGFYQTQDVFFNANLAPYFIAPVRSNPVATAPNTNLVNSNSNDSNEETLSVFGAATYELSENLRVNAGLRYTRVEKDFTNENFWASIPGTDLAITSRSELTPVAPPFPGFATVNGPTSTSYSDDDLLPSFGIEYDVLEDGLLYFTFSQGFKAGGFNFADRTIVEGAVSGEPGFIGDNPFGPEEVNAFEVGYKGTLLDGRLVTNIAAFQSDYTGVQQSVLNAATFVFSVANAAESRTRGIELDGSFEVFDGLTLYANATLMDAEFIDFIGECSENQLQWLAADPSSPLACPESDGVGTASQDLAGHETTFAPGYSGNIRASYETEIGDDWWVSADLSMFLTDEYHIQSDFDPRNKVSAFQRLNARFAIAPPPFMGADWEIAIVGKNLTDVRRAVFSNDLSASPGSYRNSLGAPRSLSIQLDVKF